MKRLINLIIKRLQYVLMKSRRINTEFGNGKKQTYNFSNNYKCTEISASF